jgi:endonuclease YncB( thermonuclease family)
MNKRIISAVSLLLLILIFLVSVYFVGKTIEKNKPLIDSVQKQIEPKENKENVKGEKTEKTLTVTRIIDGDTFTVSTGETVRLIGIDTPEKNECYSREAASKLSALILNKEISVETDKGEKDRYGRTLLYIWADGIFINQVLAKEGFARAVRYPPNTKYAPVFEAAELEAKSKEIGIWDDSVCPPTLQLSE